MFNSWSKTWNKSRKLDPISYSWHACHAFNIFWHMHDCRKIIESFQKWIPVPRFPSIWNTVLNIMISFSYFTCIGPSDLGKMTWPWKISRQHHQFHSLCEFEVASVVPVDLCVSIVTTVYSWIHSYFFEKKVFFVENVKSRIIFLSYYHTLISVLIIVWFPVCLTFNTFTVSWSTVEDSLPDLCPDS